MANKTLTAKVKFDTKSAEASLNRLAKKINDVQKAINKTSSNNSKLTTQINKATTAQNRLNTAANKTANTTKKIEVANRKAVNSANKLSGAYNSANRSASNLSTTIKRLAGTYLGVMGMKAIVGTSDNITSTQNKLNALNGGDTNLTQEQMDKMYVSSNKVRMNYTDMLANASKSMTLAGSAFQGNMDNAIRFQEIMAETYALGGASAPEMSTSMYQLMQALGSGTLQGDELRSVREGAPLAYQAIEKFAQGVYNTEESLKDLASQGKITSDMVVAAIMNAGQEMDEKFAETAWTFEAVWNRIKSAAVKAFEPISTQLSEMLNKVANSGIFEKMEQAFWNLSKVIQIVFQIIYKSVTWIADNWNWLKYVVIFALTAITAYLLYMGYQAVATAISTVISWMAVNSSMLITIGIIALIVVALVWLANQCSSVCDFIYTLCIGLAWAIIGVLAVVLAAYLATGAVMLSVPTLIALVIIGLLLIVVAAFVKYTGEIVGTIYGVGAVIDAICTNISIGWQNMCSNLSAWFLNGIADMLEGCEWLLNAVNKILEAFGKAPISIDGLRRSAEEAASNGGREYVDLKEAWNTGYSKGHAKGEKIQDDINGWGDKIKNLGSLDNLGEKLGLTFESGLLGNNPANLGVGNAYNTPDELKNIDANTGKMADSMDLSNEDLEYLRKIAEMEWKKEFTTAHIQVDMSNYNTVNGESDLDGIVTMLSDKLYEEMNAVANGVYA